MAGRNLIVACVRAGTRYSLDYVRRLRDAVARHLPYDYDMVCLTDMGDACRGVTFIDCREYYLPGWWMKMSLFEPKWRAGARVIYIDLDNVIVGDLSPLAQVAEPFAISANMTRLAGNTTWPCRFGSHTMVIGEGVMGELWYNFNCNRNLIERMGRYGDQMVIEELCPTAQTLQPILPPRFFVGYRELPTLPERPDGASMVVFGGKHKPDNCAVPWVQAAWSIGP